MLAGRCPEIGEVRGIGLMLVFTIAQGLYLSRHLPDEAANKEQQR